MLFSQAGFVFVWVSVTVLGRSEVGKSGNGSGDGVIFSFPTVVVLGRDPGVVVVCVIPTVVVMVCTGDVIVNSTGGKLESPLFSFLTVVREGNGVFWWVESWTFFVFFCGGA